MSISTLKRAKFNNAYTLEIKKEIIQIYPNRNFITVSVHYASRPTVLVRKLVYDDLLSQSDI